MIANAVQSANSNGSTLSATDELDALVQRAFARGGTFLDLLWVLAHSPQRDIPGHVLRRLLDAYELTEAVREALHDPVVLEKLDLVRVGRAADTALVEFHFAEPQSLPRATPVGVVRVNLGRIVGFYVGDGHARLRPGDIRLQWFVIAETVSIHIQRVVHPSGEHDDVLQITAANVLTTTTSLRRFYLPQRMWAPEVVEAAAPKLAPIPPLPPSDEVLAVEHRLPGRVRIRVFKLYRNDGLKVRLEQQLRLQIGIRQVSANPLTGRVLVAFDPEAVSVEDLQDWINRVVHGRELRSAEQLGQPHPPWHVLDPASALGLWRSDGERGLSEAEVAARRRELGPNVVVSTPPRSRLQIFLDQFRSLPVMLLGASAVLSLATGGLADAVVIAAVVLANATIGYRTERWAEETIADLLKGDEIMATVVRDGQVQDLPARELVPGDLILLRRGTIVPADGLLLAADSLSVDESALTGESVPVAKSVKVRPRPNDPLSARRNMVYRGTVVTGGTGRALVVSTGNFTEIGKVQRLISEAGQPETPLQRQLNLLGTQLVFATVAVCGGVFVVGLLRGRGFLRMLQTSVSLMVAAVPEGLPTVATTTLALGMRRLQQQQVLVRRLNAVETLGAVQDLCLDKTGTITWNRMSVVAAYCGFRSFARREGRFAADGGPSAEEPPELLELLRVAALCSEVEIAADERGEVKLSGTPTEVALVQAALDAGVDVVALRQAYPVQRVRLRTEARAFMDTLHAGHDGRKLLAVKGQPAQVLAMCTHHMVGGVRQPMTDTQRNRILLENERMAGRALRVLGVACGEDDAVPEAVRQLTWLGLVGIADPPRPGMAALMHRFHRAGIHTIMITGDQSATAYAVAKEVGLSVDGSLEILDATQLEELDPDVLRTLAQRVNVFSRVSPAHKLRVVQALQRTGRVVAMTGDGINDGPALRAADIGIAMGQSGSQVAREVADIVVADDDLTRLLVAIEQGRTIYDDVRKAVRFILSSNTSEILLTAAAIVAGLPEPLTPMQLLWINLVTDVLPELALGLEPPETDVMERPPRDAAAPMFSRGDMTQMAVEGALLTASSLTAYAWGLARYGAGPRANSLAFASLTTAQLLHAITCRSECNCIFSGRPYLRNPYFPLALGASMALQGVALLLPGLRSILGTGRLGLADWAVSLAMGAAPLLVNETRKMATPRMSLNANGPRVLQE